MCRTYFLLWTDNYLVNEQITNTYTNCFLLFSWYKTGLVVNIGKLIIQIMESKEILK